MAYGLSDVETAHDERVYQLFGDHPGNGSDGMPAGVPPIVRETPEYVAFDRTRFEPRWLPQLQLDRLHRTLLDLRVRQLGRVLTDPSVAGHEQPVTDYYTTQLLGPAFFLSAISLYRIAEGGRMSPTPYRGDDVPKSSLVRLDLALEAPPSVSQRPLVAPPQTAGDNQRTLTIDGKERLLIKGVGVSWLDWPQNIIIVRDVHATIHILFLPFDPSQVGVPIRLGMKVIDGSPFDGGRLPLRLPRGSVVRLHDARSYATSRTIVRYGVIEGAQPWLSRPLSVQF